MAAHLNTGTPTNLPLDVLGHIADVLAAGRHTPDRDKSWHCKKTLNMLSLTCKSMIAVCRKHLFSSISFSSSQRKQWCIGRSEFLLSHPIITTHYVKNLVLDANRTFSALEYDLLQIICDSSSLTSVRISTGDWKKLPEKTTSVILSLIQIPTLRYLTLKKFYNFPAAAFSLCYGLTELTLHEVYNLTPPSADDAMQSPEITALVSLNCSVGDTLAVLMSLVSQNKVGASNSNVAFACLKDASFTIGTQAEVSQLCKLLERATCLEKLEIYVFSPEVWLVGIGLSLAANPQPKLRDVTLDLDEFAEEESDAILNRINDELGQLSEKNVLEVLVVQMQINVDSDFRATRRTNSSWTAWAAEFDRILTDNGAFLALCKVTIKLTWFVRDMELGYVGVRLPVDLTEAHFPRLLKSTAIGFQFSYSWDSF